MKVFSLRLILFLCSFYTRSYHDSLGAWRLRKTLLPLLRKYGQHIGMRVVKSKHGFMINANLGDWLGQYLYLTGEYEPPTTKLIKSLLNENDVFLDIGANIGYYSLLASMVVGKNGKVIAFEPIPSARKQLIDNISLNSDIPVTVEDKAVSNACGTVDIYEGPDSHKGISSMRPINDAIQKIEVETICIDDYFKNADSLSVVKIDVEGAEALVIDGMKKTIEKFRPHIILEVTDAFLKSFDSSASLLCSTIIKQGYEMSILGKQGLEVINDIPIEWDDQFNAYFRPI